MGNISHHARGRPAITVGCEGPVIDGAVPDVVGTCTSWDRQTPSPQQTPDDPTQTWAARQAPSISEDWASRPAVGRLIQGRSRIAWVIGVANYSRIRGCKTIRATRCHTFSVGCQLAVWTRKVKGRRPYVLQVLRHMLNELRESEPRVR